LNDSSHPESQASQAGTKVSAARSAARNSRTSDLSSAAPAGSGLAGGSSVVLPMVRISSAQGFTNCCPKRHL